MGLDYADDTLKTSPDRLVFNFIDIFNPRLKEKRKWSVIKVENQKDLVISKAKRLLSALIAELAQ